MTQGFDTAVLLEAIPPAELATLVPQKEGAKRWKSLLLGLVLAVVFMGIWLVICLAIAKEMVDSFSLESSAVKIGSGIFFAGLVVAGLGFWLRSRGEDPKLVAARLQRFVQRNNLLQARDPKPPRLTGYIFDQGREPRSEVRFRSGPAESFPFEIARYSYRTGAAPTGSNHRPTREEWTYIALTAGRTLPRMLLDAKKNNHWFISNVPVSLAKSQRVSLPAGFADDFMLYAPNGHDSEALRLFTPEVLEMLRRTAPDFDVETADDQIMFFTRKKLDFGQPATWEQLSALIFGVGGTMLDRAEGQLASFTASAAPAHNAPARQTLRKSRFSPTLLLFAGAAVVLVIARMLFTGPLEGML